MKKLLSIMLTLSLITIAFASCGGNDESESDDTTTVVKTGLGVVSTVESSLEPSGDDNGVAQADSVVAGVTVDSEGKIIMCKIDAAQSKIEIGNDGKIITPKDTTFKSKQELGTEYGMAESSGIGKEWNEQATAFAEYCKGKTVDEVKGIAVNDEGVPTDTDLTSSVTIHVGDFIAAIEKAVDTAQELGANSTDSLGIGVETNIESSVDATSSEDGLAQADTNYVLLTFGDDTKISSTIIEGSQAQVKFDTAGKITSDLQQDIKTKRELGDDYGLKAASSIDKEWFEQVDEFAKHLTGKTIDEVKGISVNNDGAPEDTDLKSSVTISVADYISLAEKAADNAN